MGRDAYLRDGGMGATAIATVMGLMAFAPERPAVAHVSMTAREVSEGVKAYKIPQGSAAEALNRLADESGCLLYTSWQDPGPTGPPSSLRSLHGGKLRPRGGRLKSDAERRHGACAAIAGRGRAGLAIRRRSPVIACRLDQFLVVAGSATDRLIVLSDLVIALPRGLAGLF